MQISLLLLAFVAGAVAQFDANFRNGNVIVHLFEWPWNDIAEECERFLGPYGFGGVQVSPANEHIDGSQWWTRYQPVSYNLNSRSGSEWEFQSMVERCNAVGVNIYVDVVINHMAAWDYYFPGVPYGTYDFNVPLGYCGTYNNEINNYYDVNEVRNCNLVGLNDLFVGSDYVRGKIVAFLNKYVSYGVAGFRVDAAKHMWPGDLEAIVGQLQDVWWGGKPYVFQEVIDMNTGEPITWSQYTHIGDVTEFRHSVDISRLGRCESNLAYFSNFGEAWGFLPSVCAVVFVDNHDNQRNHGGGGDIVTHTDPASYKRAIAFMLAWNYGTKRIMSSYSFSDTDQGPPGGSIPINADSTCGGGWVCEHRWRQIRNMVTFSAYAGWEPVSNWWDNGYHQIAFSRGSQAFFAMTCQEEMSRDFYTGLPDGAYCDVISGDPNGYGGCTGTTVYVSGGYAHITVPSGEDSMVAIHVGAKADSDGGNPVTQPTGGDHTSPTGYARTLIFIYKETSTGQDMFIRGGIDHNRRSGCTENADTSPCAIPIVHRTGGTDTRLNTLRQGDDYLDWYGSESDQTNDATGTPLVWTTNNPSHGSSCDNEGYGYSPMNQWGDHYWMLDVDMDCSQTEDGWFELKGFVDGGEGWESDRSQSSCGGSAGGTKPYSTGNHFARCGYINKFSFNDNSCEINSF
ncbi:alpha-amylase A-like [Diadema antillarum]|uniref:alpha-amylase A-like n=1 Tax=Diadema antillarum TaxID=105358 RepID=UPI003A84DF1B